MPSTHASLHYHVVFATKLRQPILNAEWRPRLHAYLGGQIRGLGGFPQAIDGTADHVHLLFRLTPVHCLADFMREVKRTSSLWIAANFDCREFRWQEGYAVFSVSASARAQVARYIEQQEHHHRKRSFREELVELLMKSEVEFDEQYLD